MKELLQRIHDVQDPKVRAALMDMFAAQLALAVVAASQQGEDDLEVGPFLVNLIGNPLLLETRIDTQKSVGPSVGNRVTEIVLQLLEPEGSAPRQ